MAGEEINVGEYSFLKLLFVIVLGAIIAGIIVKWSHDAAQKWRLKQYIKKNPGAPIPVQMAGTIAAPAPVASMPAGGAVAQPQNTGVAGGPSAAGAGSY